MQVFSLLASCKLPSGTSDWSHCFAAPIPVDVISFKVQHPMVTQQQLYSQKRSGHMKFVQPFVTAEPKRLPDARCNHMTHFTIAQSSHLFCYSASYTLVLFSSVTNKLQQFLPFFFSDLTTSRYRIQIALQPSRVSKSCFKFSITCFIFNFSLSVIQSGNTTPTGNKGLTK